MATQHECLHLTSVECAKTILMLEFCALQISDYYYHYYLVVDVRLCPEDPSLPSPYHVFDLDPLLDHQSVPLLGLAVYYNVPECCLPKNWCVTEAAGHGRNCVLPSAGR